jgi:murein DD-endopeptidase MepM/ murein hydrolase activator NlpD
LLEGLRRASVAVALAIFSVIPISASIAGPKDKLDSTRRDLRAVRERLEGDQHRADGLKVRIARLNLEIVDAQIELEELDAEIASIRSEVRNALERRDATRDKIDAIEEAARSQAVELYKGGSTESLTALLDARSVAELNDRIALLGVAAQENTGTLVRFGRLKLQIEAQNRVLFDKEAQLARSRREQARTLAEHNDLTDALSASLRRLNHRIGRNETREGRLTKEAAALRKKILAAQATRSAVRLGTSSQGFIWPLNGPVTSPFGPRWGSVHTGIDIDGYTGQPIVASKDGRVIYRGAGMSGYGNAIVIDHGGGFSTLYGHLSGYETSLGATVTRGHVIGYVGCTGNCYGDHLHFEVRVNGTPVNPLDYLP